MTEQDLVDLGFSRFDETPESSGSEHDWHYYTLYIGDSESAYDKFSLITCASDEVENDEWKVYVFDLDIFEFTDASQVKALIDVLQNNYKKS